MDAPLAGHAQGLAGQQFGTPSFGNHSAQDASSCHTHTGVCIGCAFPHMAAPRSSAPVTGMLPPYLEGRESSNWPWSVAAVWQQSGKLM